MMERVGVLPLVFWMLAILSVWILTPGSSLKCHVCNSMYNDSCAVIEDNRHVKDCDAINNDPDKNYTLCRKEEFSVSSTKLKEKSSRTVRSCGYEKHPKFNCFYNSNHDLKETICECVEDGCNNSRNLKSNVQYLVCAVLTFFLVSLTLI